MIYATGRGVIIFGIDLTIIKLVRGKNESDYAFCDNVSVIPIRQGIG